MQAILGSCVGIALIDRKRGVCTLSHSLLPYREAPDPDRRGRWVNHAIEAALKLLDVQPARYKRLEAVLAGGGSMIDQPLPHRIEVGQANVESAIKILGDFRIPIISEDVGDCVGRKITICAQTLDYHIHRIPRLATSGKT
ncbi:MAG: chemotaxis protein CheD [Gammaproteobacteria bacterium]